MAKVTVYVTDEQLSALRQALPEGPSKAFQEFIGSLRASRERAGGGYAGRLMPATMEVERVRRRAGARVEASGGPAAGDGPLRAALTLLAGRALVAGRPELEAELEAEAARFGLAEFVTEALSAGDDADEDGEDGGGVRVMAAALRLKRRKAADEGRE